MDEETLRARAAVWRDRAAAATTAFEQAAGLVLATHYEAMLAQRIAARMRAPEPETET
jgi:hypothetical protein